MSKLNFVSLKLVRWTGWLILPVVLAFLLTGYAMTGRYGLGAWMETQTALAFHRMLHLPLVILTLAHSVPAMYLAMQRWGWLKVRS